MTHSATKKVNQVFFHYSEFEVWSWTAVVRVERPQPNLPEAARRGLRSAMPYEFIVREGSPGLPITWATKAPGDMSVSEAEVVL